MSSLRGRRVAVLLSIAAMAAAGCGSSSSSKSKPASPAASTPATPSTPSTTATTAASGPLTKASLTAAQKSYTSASAPWIAATKGNHSGKTIAAATAKQITLLQSYIAQVSALKAPSAAAAAAQQKYVSLLKQTVPLMEQFGKAASANDQTALTAAGEKIKANGAPLTAAYTELNAALPS